MKKIIQKIYSHRGLIWYTILNCVDKLINFILPILILVLFDNKQLYNEIEYIYSVSLIVIVFIESQRYYLFYGYRKSKNRDIFIYESRKLFEISILAYFILGSIYVYIDSHFQGKGIDKLHVYIVIRTLYSCIANFLNSYYRLIDRPSKIFVITILINILTILLLISADNLNFDIGFVYFFIPSLLVVTFILKGVVSLYKNSIDISYVRGMLKYSWPVIISLLSFALVNNYGKIYAFNNMSQQEMYEFSYAMRISLIILMIHTSFWAYYSKTIYLRGRIDSNLMKWYLLFLLIACLFSISITYLWNIFFPSKVIALNWGFVLLIIYTFFFCFKSCYEMYFSIWNKNKWLLLFSIISCVIYLAILHIPYNVTLLLLSTSLAVSGILNFIMVYLYVKIHKDKCLHNYFFCSL